MADSPRTLVLSATASFDGTTAFTGSWQPASDPAEPRIAASRATVGRLSFVALLNAGLGAGILLARSWDASVACTLTTRSATSAEIGQVKPPDDPVPEKHDTLLQSVTLTTAWSAPIILGSTDAVCLSGSRNTVEMLYFGLTTSLSAAVLQALIVVPATTMAVQVVTTDTTLSPWTGELFVLFAPATPNVLLRLPSIASMSSTPARLHVARNGGSWGQVLANGGDEINGLTTGLLVGDARTTIIDLVAGEWVATTAPQTSDLTVSNAVAGGVVALPVIYGPRVVSVDFTAYGSLRMAELDDVPLDATYFLQRTGDNAIPAQCKVIVDDAGDTMDGVADDVRYLGDPGSTMVVRRAAGGWLTLSNAPDRASQTILVAGTSYTFSSGWVGTKFLRSTNAAATTVTGPPAARTPIGCRLVIDGSGAGGVTFGADANIVAAGASAATLATATLVPKVVEFNGTNWIST